VHAAGLTETLAAPLLLIGVMLQMDWSLDLFKVLMILVLSSPPTPPRPTPWPRRRCMAATSPGSVT
jgi:hypothetical protein